MTNQTKTNQSKIKREHVFFIEKQVKAAVLEKVSDTETKITYFDPKNDKARKIVVVSNHSIEPFNPTKHAPIIKERKARLGQVKKQPKDTKQKKYNPNEMYHMVKKFHRAFNHYASESPTPIPAHVALPRAVWTGEELVEFLYATVGGNIVEFESLYEQFKEGLDKAKDKILANKPVIDDVLVAQTDALTDVEYFNQGSFVVMGVKPFNLFKIVQEANMGKLWHDNKPRFREEDGKIVKPPHWEENFAPEPKLKAEIQHQIKQTTRK